ncbi:NAD(P)-binding protein [Patellaria atrata CBS 101060]|uniref:NAD(P)-binding protein n=1 Tax=Patellaria atrata CBS 101060 TaxID=1346257 RepID=A0A9P4SHK4_9PEZI|nr:NAD(P)-binding protein [Patellaria atrata CBS 101060]
MPLTVLSDSNVQDILDQLTRDDILDLQLSLSDALHFYSTATEADENSCSASYQPQRTALKRNDGQTTLFMPASGTLGLGVKIVTLTEPDDSKGNSSGQHVSPASHSLSSLSISSSDHHPSPSISGTTSSSIYTRSSHSSKTPASSQTTVNTHPPADPKPSSTTPRGVITLLDESGNPRALLNASEITAFRTALASSMLFTKRKSVHDITIFGAGKQAYWHIRLALLLRGADVHHVNVINRSFGTAKAMMMNLLNTLPSHIPKPKIEILTPAHGEYDRLLKHYVRAASVIFCTVPSTEPLFPASYLMSAEGRKKGRYIAAIGSYKPHMVELHPDILRQAVAPEHGHMHFHKHAKRGGAVIVDSVEACMREAGEVIQAGLTGREVVELGELVMLKRDAESRKRGKMEGDEGGVELNNKDEDEDGMSGLRDWLQRGNVIYKSVGLGLMDVTVGVELVKLADEREIGTRIEDF